MKKRNFILPLIACFLLVSFSSGISEEMKAEKINWYSLDEAMTIAKEKNKHIFIDFSTSWCGYCKKMDKEVFTQQSVINLLNNDFIAVKVDGDGVKELEIDGYKIKEKDLTRREFKVTGYPTFWWLNPEGKKLFKVSGYKPAEYWVQALTFVKDYEYDSTLDKSGNKIQKPEGKN